MKRIKNFPILSSDELVRIRGGIALSNGKCEDYEDLSLAMPEPGRYCLANREYVEATL